MTTPVRFLASALLLAAPLAAGPWEPLFNGRDLAGWKEINGTAPFTVEGDMIVGTTRPGSPNSFLGTEKTYGDFIFECEVKQTGESNSGVMFRALSTPDYMNGRVHGYQMEIEATARAWTGGIYDEARRGWFYPGDLNPATQQAYRFGEWNRVRIEAIGTSLRTWINGRAVAHVIDAMTPAGFIALQVHSTSAVGRKIAWRNLRIQTTGLTPSPPDDNFVRNLVPNTLAKAERRQGWKLLWDGKTTKGWRGAKLAKGFPEAGWKIENGELVVTGARTNGIVSDQSFGAFELQLEFNVSEGGNSGIKYFLGRDAKGEWVGHEFQLIDDDRHPDAKAGVDGNRQTGSLYDLIPHKKFPGGAAIKPKAGEWNHARIVVTPAGHVEHWLNGIKVVEYERGSADFQARLAKSKYADIPGFGQAARSPVLLQDHGDVVKFRSIKIRKL